jgi:hypothetical protein
MTNYRTTHCPGCRSDRAPCRGAAGDLPTLALTRGHAGIISHLATLVDITIRHLFTNLL